MTQTPTDRNQALRAFADRVEKQAKASTGYSLQQTPRQLANVPTLMELSLSHFGDIAREMRALAMQEPASEPDIRSADWTESEPGPDGCQINPVMSNVCSRGTKSCMIDHTWEPASEPTAAQIDRAAAKWCGRKERETFLDDVRYFENNWRALPGLKEYVLAEIASEPAPASAPSEWVMIPSELLDRFPEINPSNYDHDDACELNRWGCEVVTSAATAPRSGES